MLAIVSELQTYIGKTVQFHYTESVCVSQKFTLKTPKLRKFFFKYTFYAHHIHLLTLAAATAIFTADVADADATEKSCIMCINVKQFSILACLLASSSLR